MPPTVRPKRSKRASQLGLQDHRDRHQQRRQSIVDQPAKRAQRQQIGSQDHDDDQHDRPAQQLLGLGPAYETQNPIKGQGDQENVKDTAPIKLLKIPANLEQPVFLRSDCRAIRSATGLWS